MKNILKFKFLILFLVLLFAIFYIESVKIENKNYLKSEIQNTCKNIPEIPDGAIKLVTKVIDGDTFLIEGGYSVRILGIDADERGYFCYEDAKRFLESLILGKKVRLEKDKENFDKYCRYLRYVFLGDKNISLEMLKNGFVVARIFENAKYKDEIISAEKFAKENKIGCKWKDLNFEEKLNWEKLKEDKLKIEIIDACSAINYIGKEVIIEGKVVDSYRSLKSNTVFLNFERPYPKQCFTAVIFNSDLNKFPQNPEYFYLNKKVRIYGIVKEYKSRPEIILKDPSQIEIGK
jgi:micrococcal nuclease